MSSTIITKKEFQQLWSTTWTTCWDRDGEISKMHICVRGWGKITFWIQQQRFLLFFRIFRHFPRNIRQLSTFSERVTTLVLQVEKSNKIPYKYGEKSTVTKNDTEVYFHTRSANVKLGRSSKGSLTTANWAEQNTRTANDVDRLKSSRRSRGKSSHRKVKRKNQAYSQEAQKE